jgi:hypothetical protein
VVDIDVGVGEQLCDNIDMAALGGGGEGDAAEAVGEAGIGLRFDSQFEVLQETFGASIEERVVQAVIADIDIGAGLEQGAHGIHAVSIGGSHDGCATAVIAAIDLGAGLQAAENGRGIACFGGADELGGQVLGLSVHGGGVKCGNR